MKTIISFSIGCLLVSTSLFAQGTNDGLTSQITKETCDELSQRDFSRTSPDEMKMLLGLALIKVMGKHQAELGAIGVSTSDPKSIEKLATSVGMLLVAECPPFLEALTRNPNTIAGLAGKQTSSGSISGKLVKIVDGEFTHLQVEDASGRIEKLWWMEYFNGSNILLADSQGQLNKPIKVNYVEREIFNSTLRDYVKVKVITSIE
jgi:hypothetical protein